MDDREKLVMQYGHHMYPKNIREVTDEEIEAFERGESEQTEQKSVNSEYTDNDWRRFFGFPQR